MSATANPRHSVYVGDHRALTRTVHGHTIFVDTRDLQAGPRLLLDGVTDPAAGELLRRLVRPGMTVLELGAGFGERTLLLAELVGEGGQVHAVETDPLRSLLLADSLVANALAARVRVAPPAAVQSGLRPDLVVGAHAAGAARQAADEAGLVELGATAETVAYGHRAGDQHDIAPLVLVAFADELLQCSTTFGEIKRAYAGTPVTLVVVGAGWAQDVLDERIAGVAGEHGLPDAGLELVAVATQNSSDVEDGIAEIADAVLSARPLPAAFGRVPQFVLPGPAAVHGGLLSPDPTGPPLALFEEAPGRRRSRLCTQEQFETAEYATWCREFDQEPTFHRKQWEYVFICEALHERGLLEPGRRGIGFGVGVEPMPAVFARRGVEIVATDLALDAAAEFGWVEGGEHARGIDALNLRGLCPREEFRRLVSFRAEDMNAVSPDLHGGFDFTWSSCCFEHLGSIEHGLRFVEESMKLLKPGGTAVHTTEFNLSSNDDTVFEGGCVIFRRRDIDRLARRLTAAGHRICLDYTEGHGPADRHVDVPPYKQDIHLRLLLEGFVSTSIGLIVQKAPACCGAR